MINQQVIDSIKQGADLKGLMESRGIILKKNGKGYVGLCPFHDDKEPSLSVTLGEKNLWQCFGCGAAGDAIRFVEMFDQLSFRDAVEVLAESMGIQIADDVVEAKPKTAAKGKTSKTTKGNKTSSSASDKAAKGKSTSSPKDSGKTSKTKPKAKPKAATKPTAASSSSSAAAEPSLTISVCFWGRL